MKDQTVKAFPIALLIFSLLFCFLYALEYNDEDRPWLKEFNEQFNLDWTAPIESSLLNKRQAVDYRPLETMPQDNKLSIVFRAYHRATLSSQLSSIVDRLTKKMGDSFKAGEELVLLNEFSFQLAVREAQHVLAKAEAEQAKLRFRDQGNPVVWHEWQEAQANVDHAYLQALNADYAKRRCRIVAPYQGKIVQVFKEESELVQKGDPLLEIIYDEKLIGQVDVPDKFLSHLRLDQPITIAFPSLDKKLTGKILTISSVVDSSTSKVKVDILVDNLDGTLRAGMKGETTLNELVRGIPSSFN